MLMETLSPFPEGAPETERLGGDAARRPLTESQSSLDAVAGYCEAINKVSDMQMRTKLYRLLSITFQDESESCLPSTSLYIYYTINSPYATFI